MPRFDMSVEELRGYRGSAILPGDFDAYWARGIAEMEALGDGCTLVPADIRAPGAECFDLWFELSLIHI